MLLGPPVPHPLQPPALGPQPFSGGLYKKPLSPNALYGVPDAAGIGNTGCCGPPPVDITVQGLHNSYGAPIPSVQTPVPPPVSFSSVSPPPYQEYGAPVLPTGPGNVQNLHSNYQVPPTTLPIAQPKKPVKFRPPVPAGLISSIGAKWGDSSVWGGQSQSHHFHGNAYIPPAVPDPDPGIRANKDNPLIIPAPTAPAIQYGVPSGSSFHENQHQATNQLDTSVSTNAIESGVNIPPTASHDQGIYNIQPSIPIELSASDHQGRVNNGQNYYSSSVTTYNAGTSGHYQQSGNYESSSSTDFNGGVQTIPIKGSQSSYTLQIQAAGGNSGEQVPHNEVLSNGLLQDILAAIENPADSAKLHQYNNQQGSDPVANEIGLSVLKQLQNTLTADSNSHQIPTQHGKDLVHASSDNLPEFSKTTESSDLIADPSAFYGSNANSDNINFKNVTPSESRVSDYLKKNKIAFYYNNQDQIQERNGDDANPVIVQKFLPNNSTNPGSPKSDYVDFVSVNQQTAHDVNSGLSLENSTVRLDDSRQRESTNSFS